MSSIKFLEKSNRNKKFQKVKISNVRETNHPLQKKNIFTRPYSYTYVHSVKKRLSNKFKKNTHTQYQHAYSRLHSFM